MAREVNLPMDKGGYSIQVLAPEETSVAEITIGADARVALPANARVVEIAASGICRIKFGNSAVLAAAGRLFPAGVATYKIPEDATGTAATHIAAISEGGSTGAVTIARLF
jgi:hypothetical protein